MTLTPMDPDRFQRLCQALLVAEYPNVVCFPVGQADGGRDAISRGTSEEVIVFQVKSARQPGKIRDPAHWLIKAIDAELPKVQRLLTRGMTEYRIITNVQGTGRLDKGSIDRVRKHLSSVIPVPSECWWSDDVERRLEARPHLKWQFPELLSGMDVVAEILHAGKSEHRERRERTLRAFFAAQAERDSRLRFKQTDLHGALFGLFVDVESTLRLGPGPSLSLAHEELLAHEEIEWPPGDPDYALEVRVEGGRERRIQLPEVGTADLLLRMPPSSNYQMVLEGAPGQGKSTLGQYVCQIHRLRILGRSAELSALPVSHQRSPLRMPFRIDLRDLATWMQGEDPFTVQNQSNSGPHVRTVETLLAAQICHDAGGPDFSVDDLHAAIDGNDVLLVFDGLDEVASIDARRSIVEEIEAAAGRVAVEARALQLLITSRPAAFANSPGFPEDRFAYLTLIPLHPSLIGEYAQKWVTAKSLDRRHGNEVVSTLHAKLSEPHIRDLARNPMQLAILLGLISTRGAALPDKRTTIYNSYMEVFFNREAEKDATVRTYRDLLAELHGFIAWHLHKSVEVDTSRGNISQAELIRLVKSYLEAEGHDVGLADALFRGAVERVVALVSRVEGTYEFEVQPLREYFCARYLYTTAPLSHVGAEERGAKPDRFDAIARNPYWLNVSRFYAGCYSKGELGGLADALHVLWDDSPLSMTDHPRTLTQFLLADYVFAQSPAATTRVLGLLLSELGSRHAIRGDDRNERGATLPVSCGRPELMQRALDLLARGGLPDDRRIRLEQLAATNGRKRELAVGWLKVAASLPDNKLDTWFHIGAALQVFGAIHHNQLAPLIGEEHRERVRALLVCGNNRHYERSPKFESVAREIVLGGQFLAPYRLGPGSGALDTFAGLLQLVEMLSRDLRDGYLRDARGSDRSAIEIYGARLSLPDWMDDAKDDLSGLCRWLAKVLDEPAVAWASPGPWSNLIGRLEHFYGVTPLGLGLSVLAARTIKEDVIGDAPESLRLSVHLIRNQRVSKAWRSILSGEYYLMGLGAYFSVAPVDMILEFQREVQRQLADLWPEKSEALWCIGHSGLSWSPRDRRARTGLSRLRSVSGPFFEMLTLRLSSSEIVALARRVKTSDRAGHGVRSIRRRAQFQLDLDSAKTWTEAIPLIRRGYAELGLVPTHLTQDLPPLPPTCAKRIIRAAVKYPLWLVELSEAALRLQVGVEAVPVGEVAKREAWFDGPQPR